MFTFRLRLLDAGTTTPCPACLRGMTIVHSGVCNSARNRTVNLLYSRKLDPHTGTTTTSLIVQLVSHHTLPAHGTPRHTARPVVSLFLPFGGCDVNATPATPLLAREACLLRASRTAFACSFSLPRTLFTVTYVYHLPRTLITFRHRAVRARCRNSARAAHCTATTLAYGAHFGCY